MKRTDKSLLEQMQISDTEISHRMTLLGLDRQLFDLLTAQQAVIEDGIDDIVDEFYEAQTAVDEIALLIGDAETLARLRAAQRMYVIDLFRGIYNSEYVNNRLRIGMVHKRIGVEPKLYLAAVRTLKEIIFRTLARAIQDSGVRERTLDAVDRLLNGIESKACGCAPAAR